LSTAWATNSRVLLLCGQIPTTSYGRGNGALHEIPDQSGILRSLTKWHARARSTEEIPRLVHEAMRQLRSGLPRPVALEIAPDLLSAAREALLVSTPAAPAHAPLDPAAIAVIATALRDARRPLIWAGGGARGARATEAILRLSRLVDAPVAMSINGLGAIPGDDERAVPPLAGRALAEEADVVLVLGSRFMKLEQQVPVAAGARVILVDADPEAFREPRRPWLSFLADVGVAAAGIADLLAQEDPVERREAPRRAASARADADARLHALEPQRRLLDAIRRALPEDGIMVGEYTQISYAAPLFFRFPTPESNITPGYQGTLGYGYATALGASVGAPGRPVVSVNGDGGFGWNLSELATARHHGIPTIAIVFDDGEYGNVARDQKAMFAGRTAGTALTNPDFVALADAFGVSASRAETPDELESAIRAAIDAGGPALIHVPVGPFASPWPFLL
ncbi:thiamine pyrophosphate-dependent enzyme, partial [Microbacterium sp. MYb62]|uniref:thiamine pyrophosphate-dependent enzyme n=1 Tax=Microbacterium sp. MYb62 TaxID=1848690 RepID=UPI000CFBB202